MAKIKNKKVLIFTGLVDIDDNLVGTAVIYKKIADIFIEEGYDVSMVIPSKEKIKNTNGINFFEYDYLNNKKLINLTDLVVFGSYPPKEDLLYSYKNKKIIMTYMWSVSPIGSMEFKDFSNKDDQIKLHRFISASYNLSLLLSDKIFCRDEKIRSLILGSLISLGRVNLENYEKNKKLENLIEEAPFGVDNEKAIKTKKLYRGIIKGINNDDFILLWNGGVWNWNDGVTLIKAMSLLKNKKIKLIFQGFKHPSKNIKISTEAKNCLKLSEDLGVKDINVFFVDTWVPYKDRANYLLEADLGIVSSPDIPEANFFLKTRIYDYLWSETPIMVNNYEAFSNIINSNKLGFVLGKADYKNWAKNIEKISKNKNLIKEIKNNIRKYKKDISWSKTLLPIKRFAKKPISTLDNKNKKNKLIQENIYLNNSISL